MLGVSYLVPLDILRSILLFVLIFYVQLFLIAVSGSPIWGRGAYIPGGIYTHLRLESLGALLAFAGVGLYEARRHLRDVFRKAFGDAPEVDDSDELLSYRTAVVGSIAGIGFICYWLHLTGIETWLVPVFMVVVLVTFVGITRILAEAGVVIGTPASPMQWMLNTAGTERLGAPTGAGFFLGQPWAFPNRTHVMGSTSTVLKLTLGPRLRSRPLFYALVVALLVGGATAAIALLHFGYKLGVFGFANSYHVIKVVNHNMNYYGRIITEPEAGQPIRLIWPVVGAAVMGLLIFARKQFLWWPIHPIGYPIGSGQATNWWINIFAAWLIKRNVLKFGGASLYGRTRPFFLGMILGQAVISSIGSILEMVTGRI